MSGCELPPPGRGGKGDGRLDPSRRPESSVHLRGTRSCAPELPHIRAAAGPPGAGEAGQLHGLLCAIRKCAIGDRAYGARRSESQVFR
jgi:hypothetical protein